jgi:serine/threonine protein phosphatase 1
MIDKVWSVGDIHGCYRELMALYKKLLKAGLKPEKDIVVFMGDYMDRGPDSNKVVDQLIKWHKQYPHWIFLYGNHEDILKNWVYYGQKYQEDIQWSCFLYNGGKDTLRSYGLSESVRKGIPEDHLNFLLKETKFLYWNDNYVFVHGGLVPKLPIEKHLLNETYINAMLWARDDFINSDYDWGKKIIFGHTPAYKAQWGKFGQPIIMKNKIGLDGAVCANKLGTNLIAVELPAERFYLQEAML